MNTKAIKTSLREVVVEFLKKNYIIIETYYSPQTFII